VLELLGLTLSSQEYPTGPSWPGWVSLIPSWY
jgi:hypothetical protein